MAQENSQLDEDMVDDSYFSQCENPKKLASENGQSVGHQNQDSRKGDAKRRKQLKKSKSRQEKSKSSNKRSSEEQPPSYYRHATETVAYFTKIRSLKIAKEREDIVESRSLGMKVSLFCGLTATQIQDRIQQDIETISNAITCNERSDSDGMSNSPHKDSERDIRSWRGAASIRNGSSSVRGQNEATYTRKLRTRRSKSGYGSRF